MCLFAGKGSDSGFGSYLHKEFRKVVLGVLVRRPCLRDCFQGDDEPGESFKACNVGADSAPEAHLLAGETDVGWNGHCVWNEQEQARGSFKKKGRNAALETGMRTCVAGTNVKRYIRLAAQCAAPDK